MKTKSIRDMNLTLWRAANKTGRGLQSALPLELEKTIKSIGATVHRASMRNKFRAPKIVATARGAFGVRELAPAFNRRRLAKSACKPGALHTLRETAPPPPSPLARAANALLGSGCCRDGRSPRVGFFRWFFRVASGTLATCHPRTKSHRKIRTAQASSRGRT